MAHSIHEGIAEQRRILEAWKPLVGDLYESNPQRAQMVATLLENQKRNGLVAKDRERPVAPASEGIAESAGDQSVATLPVTVFPPQYAYPVITQVFRQLIATELVQVSAINAPYARVLIKTIMRSSGPTSLTHAGSYGSLAEATQPAYGRMNLSYLDVQVEKYSFAVKYTLELLEDAKVYGINIEAEVLQALAEEIKGEIDWLVINDLVAGATGNTNWSATYPGSASYLSVLEYNKTIWHAIVDAKNAIFSRRYTSPDYIVCAPDVAGRLEKLEQFGHTPGMIDQTGSQGGVVRVGNLDGQFRIYKCAVMPAGKALMGITGQGYIFAPYVPLELTPPFYSTTQEWEQGIRSRFARKLTLPDAFQTLTIT